MSGKAEEIWLNIEAFEPIDRFSKAESMHAQHHRYMKRSNDELSFEPNAIVD